MKEFEAIFGIKKEQVKKNCVLLPFLSKGILSRFEINNFTRAKLYASGSNDDFTLIHTGMGAGLVGDAVLHLSGTACRNIILFGSCGLVDERKGLSIGSLVSPFKSYAYESFSQLLLEKKMKPKVFYAEKRLFDDFIRFDRKSGIKAVTLATISSLKLEEEMFGCFDKKAIEAVDMECSAFFSAAEFCGINAIALLYISDIIKKKPFYTDLDKVSKEKLSLSSARAVDLVCAFIKKNLTA